MAMNVVTPERVAIPLASIALVADEHDACDGWPAQCPRSNPARLTLVWQDRRTAAAEPRAPWHGAHLCWSCTAQLRRAEAAGIVTVDPPNDRDGVDAETAADRAAGGGTTGAGAAERWTLTAAVWAAVLAAVREVTP